MNYEQRKRQISAWLMQTLKRYEVPSHMDEDACREEMVLMVEDINSEIPKLNESGMKYLLEKVAQYVRKNQSSRKWPTINIFTKGVKEYRDKMDDDLVIQEAPKDFDPSLINAKRIKNLESVGEWWIVGGGAQKLLQQNLITEDDLKPYMNFLASRNKSGNIGK